MKINLRHLTEQVRSPFFLKRFLEIPTLKFVYLACSSQNDDKHNLIFCFCPADPVSARDELITFISHQLLLYHLENEVLSLVSFL